MRLRKLTAVPLLVLGTVALSGASSGQAACRVLDSGPSAAHAVNDRGLIAGWTTVDGVQTATLWAGGEATSLPSLAGTAGSQALGVNGRGTVVGFSRQPVELTPFETYVNRAVLWQDGRVVELGTLGGGDFHESVATAVNKRGQVVGYSQNTASQYRAFLWEGGVMRDLGALGGQASFALAVNDGTQVVGYRITDDGDARAFLWERGIMSDLGTPASFAFGISQRAETVGYRLTDAGVARAVRWDDGGLHELGTLGGAHSEARAISARGVIAGTSTDSSGQERAFIWSGDEMHPMTDDPIGFVPSAINGRGLVVGHTGSGSSSAAAVCG